MSVNTKLTAIADEVRTISGTAEAMSLDDMATNVGEANAEVNAQTELLTQAVLALNGKTGGGDGSGGSKEPCTVTLSDDFGFDLFCAYTSSIDNRLNISHVTEDRTLNAYKGDRITVVGVFWGGSSLEESYCAVDTNMEYIEFINEEGCLAVEFLLTEDVNSIAFKDYIPEW